MSQLESDRLHQVHWLVTEGRRWLADGDATEPEKAGSRQLNTWQKALLQEQRELRKRAGRRFPSPEKWIWSERSLAQASDWWCAGFKASLFPKDCEVVDACCGAGADLVALSQSHQATGIDSDPFVARLAESNVEAHGLRASIVSQVFHSDQLGESGWLHIDPDRRPLDCRTSVADEFNPPFHEILHAAENARGAVIKLAPQTQFSSNGQSALDQRATRVWLGNLGECRQQLAVWGQCREMLSAGQVGLEASRSLDGTIRMAVLAEPGCDRPSEMPQRFSGHAAVRVAVRQEPMAYLFDLHSVLHAADLQSAWAADAGLSALGSPQGYFTSDQAIETNWAQVFQVLDVVAWDDRKVRKTLRGLRAGIVEVKNRLVKLDANDYQRRYSKREGEPVTLLVSRIDGRYKAVVAKRIA